ncbi:MAG: penicillin acylase family protein [bacterium]|nr:penicillin acylase family protein [bacterium]
MNCKGLRVALITVFLLVGFSLMSGESNNAKAYRDNYGVPHIYAQDTKGLFASWGYVLGQDTLFQLVVMRATVWGKVAELYGPGANNQYIEFDKLQNS